MQSITTTALAIAALVIAATPAYAAMRLPTDPGTSRQVTDSEAMNVNKKHALPHATLDKRRNIRHDGVYRDNRRNLPILEKAHQGHDGHFDKRHSAAKELDFDKQRKVPDSTP